MKLFSKSKSVILGIVPTLLTLALQPLALADLPDDPLPPNPSINLTTSVKYIVPAKGVISKKYDQNKQQIRAIDIANLVGTPIYAAADGIIEKAGWNNGGYGNIVEIRHQDGSMTRYGHISKILVKPGQQVHQSETIAQMGSTGFSAKPHLHFEIHMSGKEAVNPMEFLPQE